MAAPIIPIGSYDPTLSTQLDLFTEDTAPADTLIGKQDCDICGFTFNKRDLIKNHAGLMVCRSDYEIEHERTVATKRGV